MQIGGPTLSRRFKTQERALAVSPIGSPFDVQQQLADRYRAGLGYLELRFVAHDPDSFVEMASMVSADVLPALHTLTWRRQARSVDRRLHRPGPGQTDRLVRVHDGSHLLGCLSTSSRLLID
jgi:hypothetical protein